MGVDLGFLNNRVNIVTDAYWRDNFDLMGYFYGQVIGRQYANVASMKSHGVEATISSTNIKAKDFQWNTDLTFAYNYTEITDLMSVSRVIDLVSSSGYAREGYPHRALFSFQFQCLNDEGIPQIINEKKTTIRTDVMIIIAFINCSFLIFDSLIIQDSSLKINFFRKKIKKTDKNS